MANPESYTLYCGKQQNAAGESINLQLTLKEAQQTGQQFIYKLLIIRWS